MLVLALAIAAAGATFAVAADRQDKDEPRLVGGKPAPIAALADVFERQRQREERLRSPEAREARERSRDAYRDSSPAEAVLVAKQRFPYIMLTGPWKGLNLPNGHRVRRYLGDHAAVVETESGRGGSFVESVLPLRVEEAGEKRPVDLTLEESGPDLVPTTPLHRVRIPKRLDGSMVRLGGSGVGIAPADAADVGAINVDSTVFYPNTGRDTDFLAKPAPRGVEVMLQLRSQASPESQRLKVALPDGAQLRRVRAPGDAIEVVRDGERLATISPPMAFDADRSPVALSYSVIGDEIAIRVPHRGKDYAYPIMVDPTLEDDQRYWHQNWGVSREGWNYSDYYDPAGQLYPDFGESGSGRFGRGLYAISGPATPGGSFGWFRFDAPGRSWIYRVEFYASHDAYASALVEGVWNGSSWDTGALFDSAGTNLAPWGVSSPYVLHNQSVEYLYLTHCLGNSPCGPYNMSGGQVVSPAGSAGNQAAIGVYKNATPDPNWWSQVWAGGAKVFTQDDDPPTSQTETHTAPQGTWVHDATDVVKPTATDPSLGIKFFNLFIRRPGQPLTFVGQQYESSCGPQPLRCPQNSTSTNDYKGAPYGWRSYEMPSAPARSQPEFTLDTRSIKAYSESAPTPLPEGITHFDIYSYDAVVNINSSPATWPVRIDRSPPTIDVTSGALWDSRNQTTDHRNEGLYDAEAPLHVEAVDGRSGAKSIEIYVDGVSQRSRGGYVSTSCPVSGACRRALDWTLRPDDYTDGDHTIRIVARDELADPNATIAGSHTATKDFQITVDRRGNIYHGTLYSGDPAGNGELGIEEWAKAGTHTARSEGLDAIRTRSPVPCNDSQPSGPQCAELRTRTLDSQIDSANEDAYSSYRGTHEDDLEVDEGADLVEPANYAADGIDPVGSGSINDALAPWQHPPPAHAATYQLYEVEGDEVVSDTDVGGEASDEATTVRFKTRIWVDAATKLPLKQVTTDPGGVESGAQYWTYARGRLTDNEVPSDFFKVPPPSAAGQSTSVHYRGSSTIGTQTDSDSGGSFQSYDLGSQVDVAGQTYCLANTARVTFREPGVAPNPGGDPDAQTRDLRKIDTVQSYYNVVGADDTCVPGSGSSDQPALMIDTYAKASQVAAAYRDEIVTTATAIQTDPLDSDFLRAGSTFVLIDGAVQHAYSAPIDSSSITTLVETDTTTIMITGAMTRAALPGLMTALRSR